MVIIFAKLAIEITKVFQIFFALTILNSFKTNEKLPYEENK